MTTQNSIDRDSIGSAPVDSVELPDLEARIDIPATEPVAIAGRRSQASPWRVFFRKPSTLFFGPLLVVIALVSFVGPFFVGDPVSTAHPVLAPPSLEYPLGTDQLGRDYLARVVYGGQVSLLVGFSVAFLCMTFGLLVGGLAGYYGGAIDTGLVKIAEFFQVLPGLVLALVAAALLGSNMLIIVSILAITMWPGVGRIVRAEAMRISQLGYVESAKAAGFSGARIIWSDVIPNAMPPVLVATSMTVGRAILIESGLAYLGIGDTNRPSWGALLNSAQSYMQSAWWLAVFPGALIFLTVLAVNMLGDGMNDSFNPTAGRVK
ncbi:ABC transporter permease [Microbacterium sp. I2]|jgi:peptide/nickel transport system permease protein|uniref:ABC transporter permease n=1 Tax=Microbacterium sp. I2 TaxID=3391826 RepID=UPI003ED90C7D|nr:ABC-type transporter, integral rane subunit [Microbacterium sp.]